MSLEAATREEEALARVYGHVEQFLSRVREVDVEVTWYVAHHEYGTWLHLAACDLNKHPDNRKYSRRERYHYACFMEMGVEPLDLLAVLHGTERAPLGVCHSCTLYWRNMSGYGSEMDGSELDDLPSYRRKEQL